MNIYTYYDNVLDMLSDTQLELIEIWKESWRKNGWNPIVLDNSYLNCLDDEIDYLKKLPSVNPENYEMSCFLRWNAMANVGGGWMCDYDVINCGFSPSDAENYESMSILQMNVPCLVYGTAEDYNKIFKIFSTQSLNFTTSIKKEKGELEHVSDMIVISNLKNIYYTPRIDISTFYEDDFIKCYDKIDEYPNLDNSYRCNNEPSILVHCSATSCDKSNLTKKEAMLLIK
jgi:hypothetical protein